MAEGYPRLAQIVWGHFHVDLVANADSNEVFTHLARDMGKHFMTVRQSHAKHGAREHLGDSTF